MINSAYGKVMKNLRKIMNARPINNAKDYTKIQASQVLFHKRYLVKTFLLFMRLNQF